MKKFLILSVLSVIMFGCSNTKKIEKVGPDAKKTGSEIVTISDTAAPMIAAPQLSTMKDSASYSIGIFVVNFYKQQGITDINSSIVAKAIDDSQKGYPMLLNDNEANSAIMNYINTIQKEKSKTTVEAGEKFLAENKNRSNVVTTESGLQYEILISGTGTKPSLSDSVICHYKGTYIDGTQFENSRDNGEPITFNVDGVIKGWTEALQLMQVGSKWKLFVPYQLGYGINDYFSIPGGSVLIFEIELLKIKKK